MGSQIPSVGRIVHYQSYGTPGGEYASECRAAIVTAVPDPKDLSVVHLCALNPEGLFFNPDVAQDEGDESGQGRWGGTWHWPEQVGPARQQGRPGGAGAVLAVTQQCCQETGQ